MKTSVLLQQAARKLSSWALPTIFIPLLGTILSAQQVTITVQSDASTTAAALPLNDPRLFNGNTQGLTFVPVDVGDFGTFTPVPAGAPAATQVINIPPGDGESGFFRVTFTLPSTFTGIQLTGSANVDDMGFAFLNGHQISSTLFEFGDVTFSTANAQFFQPGVNELVISDNNNGFGPSGAAFFATITYGGNGCQVNLTSPPLPYHQFDGPWNTDIYAHHSRVPDPHCKISIFPTIQCYGCAMTSLSMALYQAGVTQLPVVPFLPSASAENPRFLNIYMQEHPGDFISNNVDFFNTTLDVGVDTGLIPSKLLLFDDISFNNSTSTADLLQAVCGNPNGPVPVIVRVKGSSSGHYVLVTGAQPQPNGSTKFTIADPGHTFTSLDAYNNVFQIRGFVVDPAGDGSALSLNVGGAADLLMTDPQGNQTGFDTGSGEVVDAIAKSTYLRDDLGTDEDTDVPTEVAHAIHILQPQPGTYALTVTGLELGQYTLTLRAFSSDGNRQPPVVVQGLANPGSTSTFQIQFASIPGAATNAVRQVSFQSVLDDINVAFQLGLIDNQGIANSLSSKVNGAAKAAAGGDTTTTNNILQALMNEVNAQDGKHINTVVTQILVQDTATLIAGTSGP